MIVFYLFFYYSTVETIMLTNVQYPIRHKYLFFVNPVSGSGKSCQVLDHQIREWSKKWPQTMDCTVVKTMYNGFIDDYFQEYGDNILTAGYTGIVGVGGDGILYEIINALYKSNIGISTLPVGEIPTGSGNGFFQSLAHELQTPCTIETAMKWLESGKVKTVDTMYVSNLDKHLRLGIAWGLISDLDLNTEWLRMIGNFRFTLGAAYYILKKRFYTGRLTVISEHGNTPETFSGSFAYLWACNISHGSRNVHTAPGALADDGYIHLSFVLGSTVSRTELIEIMLAMEKGHHVHHPKVKTLRVRSFSLFIESGVLTLDGEPSNSKYVCVKNNPKNLNIISTNPCRKVQ